MNISIFSCLIGINATVLAYGQVCADQIFLIDI